MDREIRERFERIEANLERASERIAQLTESHIEIEAAQKNTTIQIDKVLEAQKATDERLNILIATVEQLIAKGQK